MALLYRKISWLLLLCYYANSPAQVLATSDCNQLQEKKIQTMVGEVIEGKQNGIWCIYENNILILESHYTKGLADGQWIWYYANGTIETTAHYQKGYKKGKQISYFENGNKQSEGDFEGEDRDGIWCDYTANDPSYTRSIYKKGQLHGNYKKFDKNGNLSEEGYFKNNEKSGTWNYFDVKGQLLQSEAFK